MAKLIGTAGHVDHGKTTLIKALTGIDADRLPEEKARGMTIDIGFAYLDLPEVGRVSIVDVPGHERFISNMLVGALGVDVALLCVAADEGVKQQTREHFQILELLPVDRMVVALTRADLVDDETIELAKMEVQDLLKDTRFQNAILIPVSAHKGSGLEELKQQLTQQLKATTEDKKGLWYLPVDRVFTVKGHGCVVTGTLTRGPVKVGDQAVLTPGNQEVRIRGIHSHDEDVETAEPGRRTALNLSGVKAEEVQRGQTVGAPGAVFETTCLDARVRWIAQSRHAEKVRLSIGSAEVLGKVFLNEQDPDLVQIRLQEPVPAALDQPLIIRRHSPPDLLGGGKVEVPLAKPRKRSEAAKRSANSDLPTAVLHAVGSHPNGVETAEVCRQLGRTPQELGDTFERLQKSEAIIGFAGLWLTREHWEAAIEKIRQTLEALHQKHPTTPWQQRDVVLKQAGLAWAGKPLDRAMALLSSNEHIELQGTAIRLPSFRVQLTDKQSQFMERLKAELETQPVTTPNAHELAQALRVPIQAVEEVLKLGQMAGEIVLLEGGVAYTHRQIEGIKAELRKLGKPFTAAEARDHLNASRKYIIPLLEYLDKVQFTLRIGDQRAIR